MTAAQVGAPAYADTTHNGQHHDHQEGRTIAGRQVRISVHLDSSYSSQSRGTAEVWDGNRWNEVASLLGSNWAASGTGQSADTRIDVGVGELIGRTLAVLLP
jgi:hypothetical protein